jgi:hypothetical protein
VNHYFKNEEAAIDQLEAARNAIGHCMEELDEEHGGEDGLLADARTDNGKLTKNSIKARLAEIEGDADATDEQRILQNYLKLIDDEAATNRKVKGARQALDAKVTAEYARLTTDEIKTLVIDHKWLAALDADVHSEMDRISQQLTQGVKELAERYETPWPEMVTRVTELQVTVSGHLEKMGFSWPVDSLGQVVAKKRDLQEGTTQDLLIGKKRLPLFNQGKQSYRPTKFGVMPTDWALRPLESICAFITKGSTPTTYGFAWQNEGVLFLRSECVSERGLDLSQSMFISERAHQVLERSKVCSGDILMTITGNVGRVVHLGSDFGEANINQHIARIRIIDKHVVDMFVFHFLSQPVVRRYYNLITTGQAYPQISLAQVRQTEVPIPSLAEQIAIAAVLSDMDAEIAALEAEVAKARQLKQGMLPELLTGRIRLV